MTLQQLYEFLLWCTIINFCLFFLSAAITTFAHDWVYRMHSRWYKLSMEQFNGTIYAVMAHYKIVFIFFNVVPLIAVSIIK